MDEEERFSHYSEDVVERLYPILRAMAGKRMAFERAGHTLQPTALANEAWLRMGAGGDPSWRSTTHFCSAAAETMRRILIDRGRRWKRQRLARELEPAPLAKAEGRPAIDDEPALLISGALERLEKVDPLRAKVVLLKFFGGMTNQEVAGELRVTERTVERYWAYSKTWLYREIRARR